MCTIIGIIQDLSGMEVNHWTYIDITIRNQNHAESFLAVFPKTDIYLLGGGKILPIAGDDPHIFKIGQQISATRIYQDGVLFLENMTHNPPASSLLCENNFHILTWLQENIVFPVWALNWNVSACMDGFCRYESILYGIIVLILLVVFMIGIIIIFGKFFGNQLKKSPI